jgi:c-di-GMP-binding flagellar brake protein YcgR
MAGGNDERRRDERAEARLQVELGGEGKTLSVSSLNIGAGGVYVEVPHHIEPLTKLSLSMMVPGPTANEDPTFIETEAIVVRTIPEAPADGVTKYEIACAFLNLADDHRDAINRYILTHRTQVSS